MLLTNFFEFVITSVATTEIVLKCPEGISLLLRLPVFGANGKTANEQVKSIYRYHLLISLFSNHM